MVIIKQEISKSQRAIEYTVLIDKDMAGTDIVKALESHTRFLFKGRTISLVETEIAKGKIYNNNTYAKITIVL